MHLTMLCLTGFELYSRWVPLRTLCNIHYCSNRVQNWPLQSLLNREFRIQHRLTFAVRMNYRNLRNLELVKLSAIYKSLLECKASIYHEPFYRDREPNSSNWLQRNFLADWVACDWILRKMH